MNGYTYLKPLTDTQKELLMECHEAEILKREPTLGPHYMKHVKGLFRMGLVVPKTYYKNGKNLLRFFITPLGVEYLNAAL